MNTPHKPPGPVKRFKGYFTIPITQNIFDGMEIVKWRTRLDKTEVARRMLEYFLTMPPEDQDKLLKSFDPVRKFEDEQLRKQNKRVPRDESHSTAELKTVQSIPMRPIDKQEIAANLSIPNTFKRSGLP